MKRLAIIITLLLSAFASLAQQNNRLVSPSVDPEGDAEMFRQMQRRMAQVRSRYGRPTVAVVLSGGGAKGAAHVGVLKRLEEKHIPVDMILGTSMGGLVGGLYALGYSPAFMDSLLRTFDWDLQLSDDIDPKYVPYSTKMRRARYNLLMPFDFGSEKMKRPLNLGSQESDSKAIEASTNTIAKSLPSGWVSGLNVENTLARLCVGYRDSISFADLPVPFCCVASDMVSGKSKNWTSGDIALAMRSTMSIPGLFNPVRYGGMVLADGGMRNNFPTDLARAMGADIVIGVVLTQVDESRIEVNNIGNMISQMIDMLSREAYDKNIMDSDVYIHPDLHEYNMLSFDSAAIDTILHRGYAAALEADDMLNLVASRTSGRMAARQKPAALDISKKQVLITGITFPGMSKEDAAFLSRRIDIKPGQFVHAAEIEEAVSRVFATGSFRKVNYTLLKETGGYNLQFKLRSGPVHRLGVAGRLDSEDMVAALVGVGLNAYKLRGSKLELEARIGQNWYGKAHYSLSNPYLPGLNIALTSGKHMANMILDDLYCDAGFWHHRADAYISGMHASHFDMTAGIKYDYYGLNTWLSEKGFNDEVSIIDALSTYSRSFFSLYGNARAYTLDDKYFPKKGFTLGFDYNWVLGKEPSQILSLDYLQHIRLSEWISLIPSVYARYVVSENASLEKNLFIANFVGGSMPGRYFEQQMPFDGFHRCTILGNFAMDFQLSLRANLLKNTYASFMSGFVQDAPNLLEMFGSNSNTIYGGAFEMGYDSIIGPIKAIFQYANITGFGFYVSFGYDF